MNLVVIAIAVLAVAAAALLLFRKRKAEAAAGTDAFYLIPTGGTRAPSRPASAGRTQPLARPIPAGTPRDLGTNASTAGRSTGVFPFTAAAAAPPAVEPANDSLRFPLSNRPTPEVQATISSAASSTQSGVPGAAQRVQGKTVEFFQPTDGTLQFLPGRLEVLEGGLQQHEIRFVKNWGGETVVTFGRNEGEPYKHVQLRSPTVSRQHARMRYENNSWELFNLSQTNPTVVNGQPLTGEDGRTLTDGDEVEMGEVTFRFHAR